MTIDELKAVFEKQSDAYLKFDRIPLDQRRSNRRDLHAFLLLDELLPGTEDIVSCAAHDQFWVSIDPEKLAAVVSEEQLIDLIRCGLRLDESVDGFAFFT